MSANNSIAPANGAPDNNRPPPRRFKVNLTAVQRATSSPVKSGTHRLKRSHDAICIGALVYSENGVNLPFDLVGNSLLGISKKHRLMTKLELANMMWSEEYLDTPEHIKTVQVDETRNRVMYVPKSASFIALCEKRILRKAKILGLQRHELLGFAREVVYEMQWSDKQQRVLCLKAEKAKRRQAPRCTLEAIEEGIEIKTGEVESDDQVDKVYISTPLSTKPGATIAYQCTLEPITEEEVEVETDEMENNDQVSSSTSLSTQPEASMVHCTETVKEEEVEVKAIFDDEAASEEELHDPTIIANAKNQVSINAPVAMQPTTTRDVNADTSADQSGATLSKSRIRPSQSFISGKDPRRSYLSLLRNSVSGDVTKIRKFTASLRKEKKTKRKLNLTSLLRTKQQQQNSATGCSSLGVTGGSETDTEEEVAFEAAVEPLVEAIKVNRFEKELESTLDGRYWAITKGRMSGRRRKYAVFSSPC